VNVDAAGFLPRIHGRSALYHLELVIFEEQDGFLLAF